MSLINGHAVNKAILNGTASTSVFTQALTIASTSAAALVKQANAIRSAVSTSTAIRLARAGKLITYLSTSTTSVVKALTKVFSTVVSTSTSSLLRSAGKNLTIASTSTISIARRVGKLVSATSTSTASLIKALTKTALTVASTSTTTAIKRVVKGAFTTSSSTTNTLVRQALKNLSVTSTSAVTVLRAVARVLSVVSTSAFTLIRSVRKTLSAASTSTVSTLRALAKALAVSSTSIASVIKKVIVTYIVLGNKYVITGALASKPFNDLAINTDAPVYTTTTGVTSTATVSINNAYFRTLTYLQTSVSSLARVVNKYFSVASSSSVNIYLGRFIDVLVSTVSSTATFIKKVQTTLITFGSKYVITGGLNSLPLNVLPINNDAPVYVSTQGVGSTATVSVNSLFYKALSYVQTSITSLVTVSNIVRVLSVVSTSTSKVVKSALTTMSVAVTNATNLVKQIQTTLVAFGSKYVITGGLGSNILNDLVINADNPVYTSTSGIGSTATVSAMRLYKRVLSTTQTTVNSLVTAFNKLKVMPAIVSTSVATLVRQVNKNISISLTNFVVLIKQVQTTLIIVVVSTAMLNTASMFYRLLFVAQSTINNLNVRLVNYFYKTLPVVSTATTTLNKSVFLVFAALVASVSGIIAPSLRYVLLVTTAYSSVIAYVYRLTGNIKELVYVPTRKVVIKDLVKLTSILVKPTKTTVVASEQDNLDG